MRLTKEKKDKGFTLIELIIAIAILVILTGILAPQMMRYIEKARQAKMIHAFDEICHGFEMAWMDPENPYPINPSKSEQLFVNNPIALKTGKQEAKEFEKFAVAYLKQSFGDQIDNYLGSIFIVEGKIETQSWNYMPEGIPSKLGSAKYYRYRYDPLQMKPKLEGPIVDGRWWQ